MQGSVKKMKYKPRNLYAWLEGNSGYPTLSWITFSNSNVARLVLATIDN